jgi:hypothetical protein
VVDEVEEETFKTHDREVPTTFIGRLVVEKLRRLDQVAYVRFASVYRQFKTIEELIDEARAVMDARRFEDDPTQGKLFIEPQQAAENGGNGSPEVPPPARKKRGKASEKQPEP